MQECEKNSIHKNVYRVAHMWKGKVFLSLNPRSEGDFQGIVMLKHSYGHLWNEQTKNVKL
jgi:hypothetical protein